MDESTRNRADKYLGFDNDAAAVRSALGIQPEKVPPRVRQTVTACTLYNHRPSFQFALRDNGTRVTDAFTLTAANGGDGKADRTVTVPVDFRWDNLVPNEVNYLYVAVLADGSIAAGSTTSASTG